MSGVKYRYCSTHAQPATEYDDGSIQCMHSLIVEGDEGDHLLTDFPLSTVERDALAVSLGEATAILQDLADSEPYDLGSCVGIGSRNGRGPFEVQIHCLHCGNSQSGRGQFWMLAVSDAESRIEHREGCAWVRARVFVKGQDNE